MVTLGLTSCCGLREIQNIYNSEPKDVLAVLRPRMAPFVVFSFPNNNEGKGKEITEYIRKYKMGEVYKTPDALNPNSGRQLAIYIWMVDYAGYDAWHALPAKSK